MKKELTAATIRGHAKTQGRGNGSARHLRLSAFICGLLLLLLGGGGCATAVSAGTNTALDGADLVSMTDQMAMSIAGDADVQAAIGREGALKVVIQPVENRMRAEVLPRGPAEAFTARVRTLLSKHAPSRFTWIMNRDAFYRLRERELELPDVELGPVPGVINPDFALTATFSSLADEDTRRRTSYYLCSFELTDLRDRTVLWTGAYEVKKIAVKGFLD